MEFKIDTKTSYTNITPVINHLDANLTAALRQKWNELRQSGSQNLIVDLHNCIEADKNGIDALAALHEDFYAEGCSLVFTALQENVQQQIKNLLQDFSINIAPTHAEAVDIVSMEILERDLFNEES